MQLSQKRYFEALSPSIVLSLYKISIWPHHGTQFKHPILFRDAATLEKVQKLALERVEGLRNVPHKAPLQQVQVFSLTHRRICSDLVSMFKITHGHFEFLMESTFTHPAMGFKIIPMIGI